jgi:hypothetical protein
MTHEKKSLGSNLVPSKIQDVYGVKAMPKSIPAPNSGSFKNKKNTNARRIVDG